MPEKWRDIRAAATLWRSRKQEGLNEKEQREFQSWYDESPAHGAAYAEAVLFWDGTGLPGYAEDLKAVMAEMEPVSAPIAKVTTYRQPQWAGRIFAGVTALAATIVVAVFVTNPEAFLGVGEPQYQRFVNEDTKTKTLTLPDRSRITLGPGAILELSLTESARRARLAQGDAFFQVTAATNRPFSVATDQASVAVTGTTFDLQLKKERLWVAVGEGSVRVERGENTEQSPINLVALKAGEGVSVSAKDGFGEVTEVFPAEFAAWRSGMLIYRGAALSEVVEDLNRFSDVPILLGTGVEDLTLSGTFNSNNIEFVFEAMRLSLPVQIEKTKDEIIVKPR